MDSVAEELKKATLANFEIKDRENSKNDLDITKFVPKLTFDLKKLEYFDITIALERYA